MRAANMFATRLAADNLLVRCRETGLSISEIMSENEQSWRSLEQIHNGLLEIWNTMKACVERGCQTDGVLPGGMRVMRRAARMKASLVAQASLPQSDPLLTMDWINLFALAVNEENAAGGRVANLTTEGVAFGANENDTFNAAVST